MATPVSFFEATFPAGLDTIVQNELRIRLGGQETILPLAKENAGLVQFTYYGKPGRLLQLKTVLSLFYGTRFDVPRPLALMGDQNFRLLMARVDEVIQSWPKDTFHTLHLAAAGSDSTVMVRFADEIARLKGLTVVKGEGDLLVRVRKPLDGSQGWEVLLRMSPRPLSLRKWRVRDFEGGLNAALAHGMVLLTRPTPEDTFLNLTCGSGTLLVERALCGPVRQLIGSDGRADVLGYAAANLAAGGFSHRAELLQSGGWALPLADHSVNVLCADLPQGNDPISHEENLILYPRLLKEAARVAKPRARAVFLTYELRVMDLMLNLSQEWVLEDLLEITLNNLQPRIYCLRRVN